MAPLDRLICTWECEKVAVARGASDVRGEVSVVMARCEASKTGKGSCCGFDEGGNIFVQSHQIRLSYLKRFHL